MGVIRLPPKTAQKPCYDREDTDIVQIKHSASRVLGSSSIYFSLAS